MCGITGILEAGGAGTARVDQLDTMVQALAHRGPDDKGTYVDPRRGLLLGHTRLAIIDTSRAGHQPMVSRSGRYVLVFNGEIYNASELARSLQLEERERAGHSDTEVLLELIDRCGIESALAQCNGMLALAVWDTLESRLSIARDRVGIKPLYLACRNGLLAFASEIKAICCLPEFSRSIDRSALCRYVNHGYVPGPSSILENIRKLPPGHLISIKVASSGSFDIQEQAWWSLEPNIDVDKSSAQAVEEAEDLLRDSVRLRLNSDRPLGVLLSGGVDSTLVAAMATQVSQSQLRTFSIGFEQRDYDESRYAADIATYLETDHVEYIMSERDVLERVPLMGDMFDEPFADSSQLPTSLVFSKASEEATVCLSGDGGDELHCGYDRYAWTMRFWNRMRSCPGPVRKAIGSVAAACPDIATGSLMGIMNSLAPRRMKVRNYQDKWQRAAHLSRYSDFDDLYFRMLSLWPDTRPLVEGDTLLVENMPPPESLNDWHRMMYRDFHEYLPDDILVKVDRTSMAVGVEARVPMLDHRLVEFAWSLPIDTKRSGSQGKWVLKSLLEKHVPRDLWDRPKQGFSVPLGNWLRGPLRSWVEDMLDVNLLEQQGFFNPKYVRGEWAIHCSGRSDRSSRLWPILMFQSWLEANK